ncbi:MAG: TerC family protein [Candidatus Latescibacteria bacterium]|nr:TerC family protein [Candidatus Latescibacterota bacterium]
MEWLSDPQAWVSLATLTALEIVLGIDNVIFIAILSGKLPAHQQQTARTLGLGMALITRLLLLASLTWIMQLTQPLFTVLGQEISGRDLILLVGGLFLIAKSTLEIHESLEGGEEQEARRAAASFAGVIVQIMFLDIIFSLDSVITAIGLASQLAVMVVAVVIAVIFMMLFSGAISAFVERRPTIKMLALSFLLLVGLALMGESFDLHIPKGYIYFAMAFSVFVELLNTKLRKPSSPPVHLRHPYPGQNPSDPPPPRTP